MFCYNPLMAMTFFSTQKSSKDLRLKLVIIFEEVFTQK